MQATYKNPAIESLLTSITGRDRVATVASNTCVTCGGAADTFMCQSCQDSVFGKDVFQPFNVY